MKVMRLTRWSEFVEHTEALDGCAFRGHVSAQWPLVPSLTRRLQQFSPDPRLWPLRESRDRSQGHPQGVDVPGNHVPFSANSLAIASMSPPGA
jgi:hypothetical protein